MGCAHTGCVLSRLHGQQHPLYHLALLPCLGMWAVEERALLFTRMCFFDLQQAAYVSFRAGTPSECGICMLTGVMGSCQVWAKPLERSVLCSTVPGVELWAYPSFELHGWQWHVDLGIFFSHHAQCPLDQERISNPTVYWRGKKGRTDADGIFQLEWAEAVLASTSRELVSTDRSQSLPGSLGKWSPGRHPGVCQQTVYGPEKSPRVSLAGGLHNIFHIMKEILHSCKLAGKLANKAVSQSKVLAYWNCW